jgi:serine/threonine protein kinase/WD40 repeat protein
MAELQTTNSVVGALAEEFLEQYRQGARPSLEEYAERFPEHAAEIRELFPALLIMEKAASASEESAAEPGDEDRKDQDGGEPRQAPKRLGDYRIIREVGRGGMGIVYEAEQESLGRRVALKVLSRHMRLDAKHSKRFQREAKAAAGLHHTNIVPVFGVGEQDGTYYYVMQFIRGFPLDAVLEEVQRMRDSTGELVEQPNAAATTQRGANVATGKMASVAIAKSLVTGAFPSLSRGDSGETSAQSHVAQSPCQDAAPGHAQTTDRPSAEPAPQATVETMATRLSDTLVRTGKLSLAGGSETAKAPSRFVYYKSVAHIGLHVADALAYAHHQGVLHRNVKPSNLLLDPTGGVWLTDFGLAKTADEDNLTDTGHVVGTLRYMAPEMFSGRADARSDVYALGVTLYEMLALRPAYAEADHAKLVSEILGGSPPRLRTLDPHIPRDLETIVHKTIDREPSHRYQSAAHLVADLERFLGDEPIKARPLCVIARCARWCRRNPGIATLTAAVALLLLVVGIGGVSWAIHAEAARRQTATAEDVATHRLFESYVAQANASRWSRRPGQRVKSLEALKEAAALLPRVGLGPEMQLTLRNEAIASMALLDLEDHAQFKLPGRDWFVTFDSPMERYACLDASSRLGIRRLADHQQIAHLPITDAVGGRAPRKFASAGRYLVGCDPAGRGWAWDIAGERLILEFEMAKAGYWSFSCSGDLLAVVARDESVRIYDLTTAKQVQSLPTRAKSVSLSPDGSAAAISFVENTEVQVWDCRTGRPVRVLSVPAARYTVWSPDGKLLACATENDYTIVVSNVTTGQRCAELRGVQNSGLDFSFNDDGTVLASCDWDGTARLWDPIGGRELLRSNGYRCEFRGQEDALVLAWEADISTWRLRSSAECRTLRAADSRTDIFFQDVDFCWSGPLVAGARGDGLRIWDLRKNAEVAFAPIARVWSVLFHQPTASLVSSGRAGVYQWPITVLDDAARWRIGPPRKLMDRKGGETDESTLVQSRDGRRLAAVIDHRKTVVFDLAGSKTPIELQGGTNVTRLALAPDGRWTAGSGIRRGVKIWDAETGGKVGDIWPECLVANLSFSPDGKRLAACDYNEMRIYETGAWKVIQQLSLGANASRGIAWSPDGELILVNVGGLAKLLDAATGVELASVTSPNEAGSIESLCFSPDNGHLAIVYRNAIEAWDLRAVRRRLADMHLDWDSPELPAEAVLATPEQVEFDLGVLAPKTPRADHMANARLNTLRGDWKEAAENYERALASGMTEPECLLEIAAALLMAGKSEQYRELCRGMLERHSKTKSARAAYILARTAVFGEGPLHPDVRKLAAKAVEAEEHCPWYLHTLGLVCYREGNLAEAVTWLERACKGGWHGDVQNWLALAIVYDRLDNAEQADLYWSKATKWLENPVALHPHDRVAVKLLRDEAERLRSKRKGLP